jgi:hypothetical protein
MTDYNLILDSECDPDAPLKSELAYRWRDNAIAMAEGSDDAPYPASAWHPYNGVFWGDGNDGKIYDFAVDGAVTNIVTPDFDDKFEYRLRFYGLSHAASAQDWRIEMYLETTGAYNTAIVINASATFTSAYTGVVHIERPRQSANMMFLGWRYRVTGAGGALTSGDYGDYHATAQKRLRARWSTTGNNTDAGTMFMDRRLVGP